MAKKKSKYWLMRMHQIEILHNFVPNLREIYLFLVKNGFVNKTWAYLASWQPNKADCRVKNGIFGENLVIKGRLTVQEIILASHNQYYRSQMTALYEPPSLMVDFSLLSLLLVV